MAHPLLVNAAELLRRPGTDRSLHVTLTVEELGISDPHFVASTRVEVELRLESLTDGIVVDGTIAVPWAGSCRRCLAPVSGVEVSEVHELYQQVVVDPDAFPIAGEQLDLRDMARELVVLDAPGAPLCRPECAGLCPVCGTDRNVAPCRCDTEVRDPRWAALDELREQ